MLQCKLLYNLISVCFLFSSTAWSPPVQASPPPPPPPSPCISNIAERHDKLINLCEDSLGERAIVFVRADTSHSRNMHVYTCMFLLRQVA